MRFRTTPPLLAVTLLMLAGSLLPPAAEAGAAGPQRRFRFEAAAGETLLVHGEYPRVESSCVNAEQPVFHARFRGTLEVAKASDGSLFLIGELGLEEYVKGIAEVPRHWPIEALKAQVVAARTYAMNRLNEGSSEGRALGYDLCATQACQVYVGMQVEAGPWGHRWVKAVEETAGEVLLHQGEPAVTFYSSTSNGRTYPNEQMFGGAPLPYLRGIVEKDDGASPLARWRVTMPLADLTRFLEASGAWAGGAITKVSRKGDNMLIRGGGERVVMEREELRDEINSVASCLDRDYPSVEADGYRLPQTIPSKWYEAKQTGSTLVFDGRGWGHGVGMVQWGAKGKADRGLTYSDILASYYGGLRPVRTEVPDTIRVLVAEDLQSLTVAPSGQATMTGAKVVPQPPWRVTGGRRLRASRAETPSPSLEVAAHVAKVRDGYVRTSVEISNNASVRLGLLQNDVLVASTPWRPHVRGVARIREPLPAVAPGMYSVAVTAKDGVDEVIASAGRILVPTGATAPATPSPRSDRTPRPGRDVATAPRPAGEGLAPGLAIVLGLAVLLLLLVVVLARRRGSHRA
jgi:SpoIID/LytB domain protein